MDTVATLLKAYSAPPANYSRGAWYAAAALITDYFVSEVARVGVHTTEARLTMPVSMARDG